MKELGRPPCYQCPFRVPGCHGSCEDYIAWTKIRDQRRLLREDVIVAYMAGKRKRDR